ncbi:hypothetical protein HC251_24585 [Iamia sp. SCSIO 61187]|uniref:DUF6049 family protein n=1 Tax=Iamia sp. SCSIO 61187 TaxID=2722752 RepID=UPI001C6267BD|nr:DUF6049 family protein [Iamia sp. SCSIO 61187]QYG95294.1 hypothetical protein HC251_24585 [Iamia sp. SCSIO 61187]
MIARRLAAVLACLAVVGVGAAPPTLAVPSPVAAQAAPAPAPTFSGVSQTPWVTRDGTWNLTLALDGAPPGSTITADVRDRVADEAEYTRALLGVVDGQRWSIPDVAVDATATRPDGTRAVTLAVSLRRDAPDVAQPGWRFLPDGLPPGVYPVDIQLVDADGTDLTRLVVPLTRVPSGEEAGADDAPLLVAPVLALGDDPTLARDGGPEPDDAIAQEVDDLLEGLLAAEDLPLTLVPRPAAIESLAREEDGPEALADLLGTMRSRQVVDGPYVDVPLGPWVERGLTDELTRQRARGNRILTEHLGRVDSSTWDGRSGLTPAAAAALWSVGVRSAIVAPGALGPEPVRGPVTIPAGAGQTIEAVVPDPDLTAAMARRDDPILDAADLAASLAIRAASATEPQGVALSPPPGWMQEPARIGLMGQVLLAPDAPVRPVTLADLLEAVPAVESRELVSTVPVDLGEYPERLGLARARLGSYAAMVGTDVAEVGALDQRLLLSGSASLTAPERSRSVEIVLSMTERRFRAVQAPASQVVTLTSSDGSVPLTVVNDLDEPATVTVEVRSNSRVEVRSFDAQQVLEPGPNRVSIPVHTRAPGDSSMEITIRSPDGEVILDEVDYTVRSTAVPGVGIVLSIGAVAFLIVWWARHWLRDRRGRGGDDGGGDDPPDPDPTPGDPPAASAPRPAELVAT